MVDSTIVAYFVIHGANTPMSESVRAKDANWCAPALLRHELISVVTTHVRHKFLTRDEGIRAYRRAISLVDIDETLFDPATILNLHLSSDCTSYDCQFVALAESKRLTLVTTDKEVLEAFPAIAVHPNGFSIER